MPLGIDLGLGPGDFVLDGDPVTPCPKGGRPPKFSAHVYCDQTAGWRQLTRLTVLKKPRKNFNHFKLRKLEKWANAQRDGRPAEYRWRPLFNAATFG